MNPEVLEGFEDVLRHAAFTVLSRLQSGTEEVVRLDIALANLRAALSAPAAAPRPAPAEPQGAEAPQEIKSLRDRIIEGELELDGTHPPTLMFLMAEHWKAVATEHYAKAKDYDRLKHELRLSRTAPAPQPAGGEREAFEAWCSKRGQDYERLGDGYTNDLVQRTWQGWQARADLSQPAAQQDPVAWMWQHPETGMTGFVEHASPDDLAQWERMNRLRQIVTPLYTQAEERKPLTDEQINDFVRRVTGIAGGRSLIGEQVTAFTRIVESAHGITATKGDSHA